MKDYRLELCLIDEKEVAECLAQDFSLQRIYFELPMELAHLDADHYCTVPSYWLPEHRVRLLSKQEKENFLTYGNIEGEGKELPYAFESIRCIFSVAETGAEERFLTKAEKLAFYRLFQVQEEKHQEELKHLAPKLCHQIGVK